MKIYNKFVESRQEPSNKNDIWFDGSSWNMYKEGMWKPFTVSIEQAEALYKYVEEFKLFKIVEALPETGQDNIIYLVENKDSVEGNTLVEYIYINNAWEEIGKFTPTLELDEYLKIEDAPFEKGSSENSAVLKGGNNVAGLKGWYYDSIYKYSNDTIYVYLSKTQKVLPLTDESFKTSEQTPDTSLPNLYELLGYETSISLVNDSKYDNTFIIVDGGRGYVVLTTVGGVDIPFTSIKHELINDPEDYSIYCLSEPDKGMFDIGQGSIAGGYNNKATNGKATAFGFNNHAYGKFSFAEGRDNEAGYAAHAEGRGTKAEGEEAHAEGLNTVASGKHSHAEGDITEATGINAHAEGYLSKASGNSSHAEGGNWVKGATGADRINGGAAEGAGSHAEGGKTTAIADYSHAEGYRSTASGPNSHTEGQLTRTGGEDTDRPKGNPGTKSGQNAHAEGAVTFAQGAGSHAEGGNTWASGNYSHTEGWQTRTHEEANNSHAEGFYTETTNRAEHAEGEYNKSNDNTIHSVGIGTSSERKNAHEITKDGKHYIYNIGDYDGTNPEPGVNDLATILNSPITEDELNELFND